MLNFPTKYHWKFPSKIQYIEKGLQKFVDTYKEKQIKSIAFPMLGTTNGGLDEQLVINLMLQYLETCSINIEIYKYVDSYEDKLLSILKSHFYSKELNEIAALWDISKTSIGKIDTALKVDRINSIIELTDIDGVGEKTIQKLFNQINF